MNFTQYTDQAILKEIGERARQKRLNKNISQIALAKKAGISRRTVQAIEMGESISLNKFIAILRVLDSLDSLDNFLPPVEISPLQLAKMRGKTRQRAYAANRVEEDRADYLW